MLTTVQLKRWQALPGFDGLQWDADIPWRPFTDARRFARALKLKSKTEWEAYRKSGKRPEDIPSSPEQVYEDFVGWGDWLGTGNVWSKTWRPFTKARAFVRALKLKSCDEWHTYRKSGKRPSDIPSTPGPVYEEFAGWGDWLGTGRRVWGSPWRPFTKARAFVRALKLKSRDEWEAYSKSGKRPADIPSNPKRIYNEWVSWGDWLGTGNVKNMTKPRPFKKARKFARALKLKSVREWESYRKSGKRPEDIPSNPHRTYKEFTGYEDWLNS
jgi:hypothetical protein